ncbi:MAG: trehalose-6-phosphate synthase [Ktedonobacterales bacterium]|nr:trehalose-6-phosphate synthase [Ktedonobacterales bacterium]
MPAPRHAAQASLPSNAGLDPGRQVILATNRGPVEFHRDARGRLGTRRGPGGVVTALATLSEQLPLTWVAATMTEGDREAFPDEHAPARAVRLGRQSLRVRYVPVSAELHRRHYDEISNRILWFLQHYLWDPANAPNFTELHYTYWNEGYRSVNEAIARMVADEALAAVRANGDGRANGRRPAVAGSNTIVLLQDYHLYLAARGVRERLPGATVQQFIHIPWPAVRYWEFLPEPFLREIYHGLASNDVLGLQTESDVRNFLVCASEVLGGSQVDYRRGLILWRGHTLAVRAYPIPIDVAEVRRSLESAAGRRGAQELRPLLGDETRVIVRVDRLDPTKNIVRGFEAYELLLRHHEELRGQVRFLAFLVPSRDDLSTYRTYARRVKRVIERINAHYGRDDWRPIEAFFENNRPRALAAMRRADVLLVNPVIDGMNLVAKEGAAVNERDGTIILTRTAGAYAQMRECVLPTTATDLDETARRLYEALTMPEEERRRHAEAARALVERESPREWVLAQLRDAATIHAPRRSR